MTSTATETRSVIVEREIAHPPEKIWRALTEPHLIEEWLMKNDFKPVADHKFMFSGDWVALTARSSNPAAEDAVLQLGRPRARERRDLNSHPDEQGHDPPHGAVRLPSGSGAVLPGRQDGLEQLLRQAGAGADSGGVRSQRHSEAGSTPTRLPRLPPFEFAG